MALTLSMKMDDMEAVDVGNDRFYRAADLARVLADGTNVYALVPRDERRTLPSPEAGGRPRTFVSEKAAIRAILLRSDAVVEWAVDMIATYRNEGRTLALVDKSPSSSSGSRKRSVSLIDLFVFFVIIACIVATSTVTIEESMSIIE